MHGRSEKLIQICTRER